MERCSFYHDDHKAVSASYCGVHGRTPIECANELRAELERALLQNGEARKLLIEFTTDGAVCQAIASRCIGGHQEDPCKCLYCRARHQVFQMDQVAEKRKSEVCGVLLYAGSQACGLPMPCDIHRHIHKRT